MQVDVVGPMLCAKHAVRAMSTARGGKGGSIVTIASLAAQAPPGDWGVVPYEAAKQIRRVFASPALRPATPAHVLARAAPGRSQEGDRRRCGW
jgi:short-subunit dehydrogenase